MENAPQLITAADLDRMTPDERARAVNDRIVTDLDDLPPAVRQRIESTATRLTEQLQQPTVE